MPNDVDILDRINSQSAHLSRRKPTKDTILRLSTCRDKVPVSRAHQQSMYRDTRFRFYGLETELVLRDANREHDTE